MSRQFVDPATPSLQPALLKRPENLPRGILAPPPQVRELIERERAKHAPEQFARHEERLLNEWTIAHYFDNLNQEVIYRPTPQGPEVVAVGKEETLALRTTLPAAEQLKFKTFLGY